MAFIAMLLCTNLSAWAQVTVESPWVGAAIENGKTYYLYNTKAQAFLKAGNNWGTRASFGVDAYPVILEGSGDVYALSTTLSFSGCYLRASDLFMDQKSKDGYTFENVGENVYTFSYGGKYVGYTGLNTVEYTDLNDGCYWQLLTAEDIKAQMAAATAAEPFDVTALIPGANFGRNSDLNKAWSGSPKIDGQKDNNSTTMGNFNGEKWNVGLVTVSQTLKGLPNGIYELKAQAFYRGATTYDIQLVANGYGTQIMHIDVDAGKTGGAAPNSQYDAQTYFNAGYYDNNSVYFAVTDGNATIGVQKFTSVGGDWLVFDNFRLAYYGDSEEAKEPLKAQMKPQLDALSALKAEAEALEGDFSEGAMEQLAEAIAAAEAALEDGITGSLITEATAALNAAITRAENSVAINEWVEEVGESVSPETPADATFLVANPDMENGNVSGWTSTGWAYQGASYSNGDITISKFQEIWVWNANLGNTSASQTLADMPAGTYRLTADVIAVRQGSSSPVTGAMLFINDATTPVATGDGAPERFSVEVVAKDGVLTFGMKGENTTANWMAFDNVKLELVSVYDAAVAGGLLAEAMEEFDLLNGKSSMNVLLGVYHNTWLPIHNEMHAILDNLADYDDIAFLDAMTAKVEEATAFIKEISAVFADTYMSAYELAENAKNNSTPLNATVEDALAKAIEANGPSKLYAVETIEELQAKAASLLAAYLAYAPKAEANEGTLFNVSSVIVNPSFETGDYSGWDVKAGSDTGVKANSNADYTMEGCDGEYLFNTWGGSDLSISQVVKGLPAGIYSLHAVVATDAAALFELSAGENTVTYRGSNKSTGYDMALGNFEHKGGDLLIKVAAVGDGWFKVDNFRIYCEGDDTIVPNLHELALSPVAGTMLEALTSFTLSYESAVSANDACTETIKITNPKGRVLAEAALAQCAFEGNSVTVTLADTLVTSGNVNVIVPEGMFLVESLIDDRKYETAKANITYQFEMDPVEVDSPWSGATVADGLQAYLYNPAKKAFLGGANSWGTQASYVPVGLLWTVAGSGETYTLAGTVSNGGDSHYFTGTYVDGAATSVTIKEVGVDVYTLKVGTTYIGSDATTIVTNVAELDSTCYWQFVTAEERKAMLDGASVANPADATFLVRGANFNRNDQENTAWSGSPAFGGDNNVGFGAEKFNTATAEVAQEIKNVPNGVYRVDVQGFYRMGSIDNAAAARATGTEVLNANFFANDESVPVMSIIDEAGKVNEGATFGSYGMAPNDMAQAVHAFTAGLYEHSMVLTVTDGTIKLGVVKTAGVENDWLMFDNFRLTYLGEKNDVDYLGEGMLASIPEGEGYVFYTDAAGKNHFLYAAGANNWVVTNVPTTVTFSAGNVTDETPFASKASFMASNGYYMSNAANNDGTGAIKTELITGSNGQKKRVWESQVFYKNKEGKYAIRLTNSAGTSWGANCFVNVDPATLAVASGQPTLGDALYIWNIASADDPRFSTEVLSALIEQAEAIEGVYNKDVKAALEAAVAAAKEATAAEVESAQAALEAAIAAATTSIADYEAILKAVADCKLVLIETATAYDDLAEVIELAEILYADATATVEMLTELQEAKVAYLAANEVEGLVNGDFSDGINGWTGDMATGNHNKWTNVNDGFAEKWTPTPGTLADLDFYQEISGLPAGTYTFMAYVNACQQANDDTYEVTGVSVYANSNAIAVHTFNLDRDAANRAAGAELVMVTASIADGETLKVGMKVEATDANWVVIDNARLFNFNIASTSDPSTGIVNLQNGNAPVTVYSVDGKSIKTTANGVKNLEKGLYIVNGKKMYIK